MSKLLHVSSSPHVRANDNTQNIMLDVLIAMLPAVGYGCTQFGIHALLIIIATVAASILSEAVYEKCMHKKITVKDLSAAVTGLIIALNMPPQIALWIPVLGAVFAIIVVKQLYGGLGQNWMNPALAARCFLLISFAKPMTDFSSQILGFDALTSSTPLAVLKQKESVDLLSLFIGRIPGTIGEVSVIALLIGAAYLVIKKVISLKIPLIYIGTVAVLMFIFGQHSIEYLAAQICAGGLVFGAFFMATDYVTSPITPKGQIIYAVFIGILTAVFRLYGSGNEGVSYAILLGNVVVPLIEKSTLPKAFGRAKEVKHE